MTNQYFLLDSDDAGFSAALSALQTIANGKFNFTPTIVQRAADHDATHVVVKIPITEAELNATAALADLRTANYPTALCRHRWTTRENFRALGGFHMIGESERSYERDRSGNPMTGRAPLFIRQQQGKPTQDDGDGSEQDYGENSDGTTHYDALNGPQDPAIDKGAVGEAVWNKGYSYFICGGAHVRWARHSNGGNPDQANGIAGQGLIAVEDATGAAADKIFVYSDWDMLPGMFWGSWTAWEQYSSLPWEEYDTGIYVQGRFNIDGTSFTAASQTGLYPEADVDDVTQDAYTLFKRHCLQGKTLLSDLNGTTGRGRYHVVANDNGASQAWDAVHVWDTSSFTDVSSSADDATADDFEILAASAPDGSYIAFVASSMFGTVMLDMSQVQVGGTGVWEYSKGSDTWGTFTNIVDPTSGLTSGTGAQNVYFNPKSDWATDTVNGDTGYVVRWRKTGGTVTQAARGDQSKVKYSACWIHRWNDGAPTRGLCHRAMAAGGTFGLQLHLNGKGNVEFVRYRAIGAGQHTNWASADDIVISGSQLGLIGAMSFVATNNAFTFRPASYGSRYWSIADHFRQDKTHAGIQRIIDKIDQCTALLSHETLGPILTAELNGHVPDRTAFDDMPDWSDVWALGTGPYGSNGATWNPFTFDGVKLRYIGSALDSLNDTATLDLETGDKHCVAFYGQIDASACQFDRIGIEHHTLAIDFYPQATGGVDAPVSGSASHSRNAIFRYGYNDTWNGKVDTGQPAGGFNFENDNDTMAYEDGTGGNGGHEVWFWDYDGCERGLGTAYDNAPGRAITKGRFLSFNNLSQYCFAAGRNFGPEATNAVTFDGTSTYNDITANILPSVATATAIFAAGSSGNKLYIGVNVRPVRRFFFNVTTAGVGGPTLAVRYHNGTSFTAVSNLSDNTNGFSTTGENSIEWDRPTDQQQVAVNGVTKYWIEIEIVSGSFSTIPQCSTIKGRRVGPALDIQHYEVWNIPDNGYVGRTIGAFWGSDSGIMIDDYGVINLSGSQSASTLFFKTVQTGGNPTLTLAQWQALTKSKTTTDAEVDSVFGPNTIAV